MTTLTTLTTCRQRVMLLLAGVLVSWSCVGETHGVGGRRFDVRGTVVDSGGRRVGDVLVVLINSGRDDAVDWDRPEDHPGALVTRADMHGVFVLTDVPEASYYLYARSGNGQAHVRRIGFHDGGPSLAPYGPLDGVPRRAVTDVLGLFRVGPVDARRYRLSAWMPGPRSKSMPIDVTAESIDAGDLRLVPAEGW